MGFISNIVKNIMPSLHGDDWFYEILGFPLFGKKDRLKTVLENPAALFLFLLIADLYSMGEYKVHRRMKDGTLEQVEKHPILDFLANPNPMQTAEQFTWDYMFWRKLGCANLYMDSEVLKGEANIGYWLDPRRLEWPTWFDKKKHSLFISRAAIAELMERELHYKEGDGSRFPIKYKNLKQFFDISNGVGGWFSSPSRLDALYKIIQNSDNALDSKNINSNFASKFLVAGKSDPANINDLPMGQAEKTDIETKMLSKTRRVHAIKSMVNIKRFIERADVLEQLDKAYLDDAMKIAQMLKIPQDVIGNLTKGSTYENQEMARAAIISYALEPDAQDFCKGILDHFTNVEPDIVLSYSFDHLPFVQVFEKNKSDVKNNKALAFRRLVAGGIMQQEAADYLEIPHNGKFNPPQTSSTE